jgi:hypothetical protein
MTARLAALIGAVSIICAGAAERDVPALIKFVAPPYPRSAQEQRVQAKVAVTISVDRDGSVSNVSGGESIILFIPYVREAVKTWRFEPSERTHEIQVTFSFELKNDDCEGTDKHPVRQETHVSAELPALVHIQAGVQCVETEIAKAQRDH